MGSFTEPSEIDFEQLFKSNYAAMYRCALNLVDDADVAKDIVQEVFVKCWNKRNDLAAIENLPGYLITATTRTTYNYMRDKRNVQLLGLASAELMANSTDRSSDTVEYIELEVLVSKAIQKLPKKCRAIFQLSRQEGLTYPQIAEALNLSVKTVESQMGIALHKLRESLKSFLVTNVSTLFLAACCYEVLIVDFFKFFIIAI